MEAAKNRLEEDKSTLEMHCQDLQTENHTKSQLMLNQSMALSRAEVKIGSLELELSTVKVDSLRSLPVELLGQSPKSTPAYSDQSSARRSLDIPGVSAPRSISLPEPALNAVAPETIPVLTNNEEGVLRTLASMDVTWCSMSVAVGHLELDWQGTPCIYPSQPFVFVVHPHPHSPFLQKL